MKKKTVKSKKRVPKFQDGVLFNKSMLDVDVPAAKKMDYMKKSLTVDPLKSSSINTGSYIVNNLTNKSETTAPTVSTPKSVVAKNSKTVSDSYKKSLQGLIDKGNKSIDDLVKLGYGTKQGLTNLGLTAPKKATTPKPTTPKKGGSPKPTTPKKPTASDLKKEGQRLKAEGLRQKGIGMAIKGKALRNKAIDKTLYENKYSNDAAKILIKLGADPKKPNRALRAAEEAGTQVARLKMLQEGKNRYSTDEVPSKSKLTETEKKAVAKYKASPKYKKTLKLDGKKFSADELAKSNYGNNIVGDFIGGPAKAVAAVGAAGAAAYGLYKAGKNLRNVGRAVTKSIATKTAKAGGSQVAANTARKVRSLKRTLAQSAKKSFNTSTKLTKEKLGREFAKNLTEKSAKEASKKGAQKLLGPGKGATPAKGTQLKFNFRKGGKITKTKRGGKKC
jgi:hypothetical protein